VLDVREAVGVIALGWGERLVGRMPGRLCGIVDNL